MDNKKATKDSRQERLVTLGPLPREGFSRERDVLARFPYSKATLWRNVKKRIFPAPVKLSPGVTAWNNADLWLVLEGKWEIPQEKRNVPSRWKEAHV